MKPKKPLRIIVLLSLLLVMVLFAVFFGPSSNNNPDEPGREQILAKLAEKGVAALGEPTITKLTGVEALKKSQPVIYKNARDGQYEIRYPSLLVIYDYEKNEVVNLLSITSVTVS